MVIRKENMRLATRFSFSLSCFILLLLYDTDKSLASGRCHNVSEKFFYFCGVALIRVEFERMKAPRTIVLTIIYGFTPA